MARHYRMKKIHKIVVLLTFLCALLVYGVMSASAATDGYYTYEITYKGAKITDVDSSISGDVVVPATLGGYDVTEIGEYAFDWCDKMTSVTLPECLVEIGDYAFYQTRIGSITFPNSLTKIGRESFRNINLLKKVTFGTGLDNIGQLSFSFCNNLESVTIPGNVKTVYAYAFRGCSKLATVVIEEGVNYISSYAFADCAALASITLPASITKINSGLTYGTSATIYYYEGTYVDEYLHSYAAKIISETLSSLGVSI